MGVGPWPSPIGRRATVDAVQAALAAGGSVLVYGPPGIGKSTVLDAAAQAAAGESRVLRAAAAEAEAELPYLALVDLFGAATTEIGAGLPTHLRAALDAALLRSAPPATPHDQLAVRLAVLEVLRLLAARRPVLVVLDDVQWVDEPSAGVLAFVARRLEGVAVRVLVAERVPEAQSPSRGVLCPAPCTELPLPPLRPADVAELLRARFRDALPYGVLARVSATSGGNPLYAVELGRVLAQAGSPPTPLDPLPVPGRLRQLLAARLAALPEASTTALLIAAAAARPTRALIARIGPVCRPATDPPGGAVESAGGAAEVGGAVEAGGAGSVSRGGAVASDGGAVASDGGAAESGGPYLSGLALAEAAGVVAVDAGGAVRFTHPILREMVYADAPEGLRPAVHERLAGIADDPVERARHLALARPNPDPGLASALAEAASVARQRAAPDAAAELARLAADRTPPEQPGLAAERRLTAATHAYDAGRPDAAAAYALAALRDADRPAIRVHARLLLVDVAEQDMSGVGPLLDAATVDAAGDPALLARVHMFRAMKEFTEGDLTASLAELQVSEAAAEACGDRHTAVEALCWRASVETRLTGRSVDEVFERASQLAAGLPLSTAVVTARHRGATIKLLQGEIGEAVRRIEDLRASVERSGTVRSLANVLVYATQILGRAGRCADALATGRACLQLYRDAVATIGPGLVVAADAELHGGDPDRCAMLAAEAVQASLAASDDDFLRIAYALIGQVHVQRGEPVAAVDPMRRAYAIEQRAGQRDPAIMPWHADFVESLVAVGARAEAAEVLDEVSGHAKRLGRSVIELSLARAQAALTAAEDGPRPAAEELANVLRRWAGHPYPVEEARAWYGLAVLQRRAHRRGAARDALLEAVNRFAEIGAEPWHQMALDELARLDGARGPGLTETEQRIVELVRAGATNREIAAAVFLSVKAVEANLTRLYRRLGVRNRAQLARAIPGSPERPVA